MYYKGVFALKNPGNRMLFFCRDFFSIRFVEGSLADGFDVTTFIGTIPCLS